MMSDGPQPSHAPPHPAVSIVGRRPHEVAEVYAVGEQEVERLRSSGRYSSSLLDWAGPHAAAMEFSHTILMQVAGKVPSEQLSALFAAEVALLLPDDGFVLEADDIRRWREAVTSRAAI
jgi:hypothetical protein